MKDLNKAVSDIWEDVEKVVGILCKDETREKVYNSLVLGGLVKSTKENATYYCYKSLDTMSLGDYDYVTINKNSVGVLSHDHCVIVIIPFDMFDMSEGEIVGWLFGQELSEILKENRKQVEDRKIRISNLEKQLEMLRKEEEESNE